MSPTGSDQLARFQSVSRTNPAVTSNFVENYGERLRGYLTAPRSGAYSFRISGDDQCELWLSTDATPANRVRIARVNTWTAPLLWTKEAVQRSAPVTLTAGQRYYIEALHKENGGGDSLTVGWRQPFESADTVPSEIVPRSALSPY